MTPAIAFITVQREDYLHRTLASLWGSGYNGNVHLFVGSPSVDYLKAYRHAPKVTIHETAADEWERIKDRNVTFRFNWNITRAMSFDLSVPLVVCEDDVHFTCDFEAKLNATIEAVEKKYQSYCLALYSAMDYRSLSRGLYTAYPAHTFFGTQGMFYPAAIRRELSEFMQAKALPEGKATPADLLINRFVNARQNLYLANPNLCQHIGRKTTGLGNFHSSQTFRYD